MSTPLSHLFLLRLWQEPRRDDESSVRIQVRHALSGETCNFRSWDDVVAYLAVRLDELSRPGEVRKEDG